MMPLVLTILVLLLSFLGASSLSLLDARRRHLLLSPAAGALLPVFSSSAAILEVDEIQSTITGVQFRDDRIGQGDVVGGKDVVVLHLQGLRRDGSVIVDTREQGQPILHQLGSVVNFDVFGGDSSKRPIITLGVEDGIRGMRYGGIRRIVIPSPLGYGHAGVSRYDAMKMGLLKPVPRDELLRFEVEILRCVDVPFGDAESNPNGLVAQACCTEPSYPCKTDRTDDAR
ncbi:FKBP-type peptidyl-prolyl cis-trans isomerase FkpA [Seminavis robusta]|uniref:peptidylprolyl isomerase n=1 Tax=Seminavis robusta TaxID=568900 RepID=A0A9N8DAN4_9STRA|nr:FKBP-type peptidyl-prolyl cis-trans isomerase FkpA [Seminavis robusta]|eukprot:Sro35_g022480.1 FKBP-type peptidyl-prolyl cis-trans isomerase FkpA (228) ;mRNA; r:106968-107651